MMHECKDAPSGLGRANFNALRLIQPDLHQRLSAMPAPRHQVLAARTGVGTLVAHSAGQGILLHSRYDPEKEAARFMEGHREAADSRHVILCGMGMGHYLEQAARRFAGAVFYVCEPDLELIALALRWFDLAPLIRRNRLLFIYHRSAGHLLPEENQSRYLILCTPVADLLGRAAFLDLLRDAFHDRIVSGRRTRRILVVDHPIFAADSAESLRALGHQVRSAPADDNIMGVLDEFQPELILSINYIPPLSIVARDRGLKYAIWTVDTTIAANRFDPAYVADSTYLFLFDEALIPRFRQAGYRRTYYLPLASNTRRFTPGTAGATDDSTSRCDISFVGTSMINECNEYNTRYRALIEKDAAEAADPRVRSEARYLLKIMLKTLSLHDAALFDFRVEEIITDLERQHGREIAPLYLTDRSQLYFLLGKEISSRKRQAVIRALMGRDLRVYGDSSWNTVVNDGQFHGFANHRSVLPGIYRASRINLNVSRVFSGESLTMRIFDVLACRGFVLSDEKKDLETLFTPGKDVATYGSLDELVEKVETYLGDEGARTAMAKSGYQRVIEEHSIERRMKAILATIDAA